MSRRRALLRIIFVSMSIVIATIALYLVLYGSTESVEFADPGIEVAVLRELNRGDEPVSRRDLKSITRLDAARSGVRDLSDLQLLANLRVLYISGNAPESLEPITELVHLEVLNLSDLGRCPDNGIDLTPLAGLDSLERLDLSGNRSCSRFKGLEGLTQIRDLSLRNTGFSQLEQIGLLAGVRDLDLRGADLAGVDLSPLGRLRVLERLNLRETGVTNVEVLGGLTTLRYLNLHSNSGIESLAFLQSLRRLHTLILRNVPLNEPTDLGSLVSLRRLNVRNTGLRDLGVLASLMESGALQDNPDAEVAAEVDIRDNPVEGESGGVSGYDVLRPYWRGISLRRPERLPRPPTRELVINEVMTSNGSAYRAEGGRYPDWIEIRNRTDRVVDLSGYYLSHTPDDPHEFQFPPDTRVDSGAHLLVIADDSLEARAAGTIGVPFGLSSDGATIRLTAPNGTTLVDCVTVPPIPRDMSLGLAGRTGNGAGREAEHVVFAESTQGKSNALGRRYVELRVSHPAGFYLHEFELIRSVPADALPPSAEILYTLDGSIPHPEAVGGRRYEVEGPTTERRRQMSARTYRYDGPVPIRPSTSLVSGASGEDEGVGQLSSIPTTVPAADKWQWQKPQEPGFRATVVRAAVYDEGFLSRVESHTYFVDPGIDDRFSTAVVSLIADPEDLFGYEDGIYVPGRRYRTNREPEVYWMRHHANYSLPREIGAHIEFFELDGYQGVDLDGGIRIHGGWSRAHPLKSLRLYARKDYGRVNSFDYPLFAQGHSTTYRRLMLRSGQSLFRSHLQDAVLSDHLSGHLSVELTRARPVAHFINGEYWGLAHLRERFDRFHLQQQYGLDPETVAVVESPLGAEEKLKSGKPDDARAFRDLLGFVAERDMGDPDEYAAVARLMNVDSFIDYNVVRIYSGDPDGVSKHVAVWRAQPSGSHEARADGRWRWHTWDLDNALLYVEEDTISFYANDQEPQETAPDGTGDGQVQMVRDPAYTSLIVGLLRNEEFRSRFINRLADLLNSYLRPNVLVPAVREAARRMEREMPRHIGRWGYPQSLDYWQLQVDHHVAFARRRPEIQREHIIDYFRDRDVSLSGPVPVVVDVPSVGGTIYINSLQLDSSTPGVRRGEEWSGLYFGGVSVQLRAEPDRGYRFAGWGLPGGDVPSARRLDEIHNSCGRRLVTG